MSIQRGFSWVIDGFFSFKDELEKMQRALNQSYAERDKLATDVDKIRDDLERSQVKPFNDVTRILMTSRVF